MESFKDLLTAPVARRRYQRGTLIDDKDRWVIRWREDVDGRRIRRWDVLSKKEFATKRLAQRELDRRLESINSIHYRPTTSGTFAEFSERWKASVMKQYKVSTQATLKYDIRRLCEAFGPVVMGRITAEAVQGWVSQLEYSSHTVRNLVMTMQIMWSTAKQWGYVSHDPFDGLKLPKKTRAKVYQLTLEQCLAIIEAATGKEKVLYRLLAETGMRPGEAFGLRPEDVRERSIRVCQTVFDGKIQTPKTENAYREFAISEVLRDDLRAIAKPNDYGIIFLNRSGRPLRKNHVERVFNPLLKSLGIVPDKRCGLYAFRHCNATLMDHLSVPLRTRQSRLGHARIETTLTHYTHEVNGDDTAAANQIGALLAPKNGAVQ